MRIVGGVWKSRHLEAPKGDHTRPTSDRVRESLFAVLGDMQECCVLDLYAGTGALALEALSRGASRAVLVEFNRAALKAIKSNITILNSQTRAIVAPFRLSQAAAHIAPYGPFQLVFADPPYTDVSSGEFLREIKPLLDAKIPLFAEDALFVLEHAERDSAPEIPLFSLEDSRAWGDTHVSFYRWQSERVRSVREEG